MKKSIAVGLLLLFGLATAGYAENTETTPQLGVVSGELRSFYITRARSHGDSTKDYTESAFAVGGNLGYDKKDYALDGLYTGVRFYVTEPLGGQPQNQSTADTGEDRVNATLFKNGDGEGYAILGEAFVGYQAGKSEAKAGRLKLDTPLAGADDVRMLPTLFEAAVVTNNDVTNTTLLAAQVTKVAYGTFANATANNSTALHYGYGANKSVGTFQNMGDAAIGEDISGVTALAAIYEDKESGVKLQAWDYIAADILNALYLQADYEVRFDKSRLFASMQYLDETGNGNELAGKINANYTGVKAGAGFGPFTATVALSQSGSDTDAALNGSIISPWGGAPAFTHGMVTRHGFISDVAATKIALGYQAGKIKATAASMSYEMGKNNDKAFGHEWTARETLADLIYSVEKDLTVRYRMNMTDKNYEDATANSEKGWTEHRLILSYKF